MGRRVFLLGLFTLRGDFGLSRVAIRPVNAVWTTYDGWNCDCVRLGNDWSEAELVRGGRGERVRRYRRRRGGRRRPKQEEEEQEEENESSPNKPSLDVWGSEGDDVF